MERLVYRLDDSVLAKIVQLVQLAFLTGTDVSDHMRQLVIEPGKKKGYLYLTPEYEKQDGKNIDKMFDDLDELMEKNPDLKKD